MRQMPIWESHRLDTEATAAAADNFSISDVPTPEALYFETGAALSLGLAAALMAELFFRFG